MILLKLKILILVIFHENILIYGISYKTLIGPKSLCIRFNKIHKLIRVYNETRNLVLFSAGKYDTI